MLIKLISLTLTFLGLLLVVLTTIRYRKLVRLTLQETYENLELHHKSQLLSLALTYLFIFGFIVGFIDTLVRDVEAIYTFVTMLFFCGAIFVYASVGAQVSMTELLRQKTMEIMKTFVNSIDLKDTYTKGHSEHVYNVVQLLFAHLPDSMRRSVNKSKLMDAAMLHDCGKLSIKDEVLNKPGKLTERDWQIIRTHPAKGKKMLDDTCFRDISDWVLYHHERIDGKGYYGLPGAEIPVEAKIIAIADTYSALCTDRVYRRRFDHQKAVDIMREVAGTQLDADLLGYFMMIDPVELDALMPQHFEEDPAHGSLLASNPVPYQNKTEQPGFYLQ